jgi:sodium pump decarboxylase gamma subunit
MNTFSIIIATAESGAGSSPEVQAVPLVVLGFMFVILILSLLSAVTGVMGFLFARRAAVAAEENAARMKAEAAAPPASQAAERKVATEDDPVIQAVIAAAIHSVIGNGRGRIVSIRSSSGGGWAQEGRRQIFSSRLGRN